MEIVFCNHGNFRSQANGLLLQHSALHRKKTHPSHKAYAGILLRSCLASSCPIRPGRRNRDHMRHTPPFGRPRQGRAGERCAYPLDISVILPKSYGITRCSVRQRENAPAPLPVSPIRTFPNGRPSASNGVPDSPALLWQATAPELAV